jgi:hypothetical protein
MRENCVWHCIEIIKIFLEVFILVSSANIMGSDMVFIVGEGSYMRVMKSKSPRIDPWGTPCFTVPYTEKKI